MTTNHSYHAHIYFGPDTAAKARGVCERLSETFAIPMGRFHERPVGPHPDWSCQFVVGHDQFADVVRWLTFNRDGLVVFIHPETGEALKDHTDRAIWMGEVRLLDVSVFGKTQP